MINTLTHSKNNTSDSEIYDLLHAPLLGIMQDKNENANDESTIKSEGFDSREIDDHLSVLKLDKNLKLQNEQLQTVGAFVQKDNRKLNRDEKLESHTGAWAVTALTIILAIVGIAYAATVLWRKIRM